MSAQSVAAPAALGARLARASEAGLLYLCTGKAVIYRMRVVTRIIRVYIALQSERSGLPIGWHILNQYLERVRTRSLFGPTSTNPALRGCGVKFGRVLACRGPELL